MDYNKGISIPAPLAILGNHPNTTREVVDNIEERNKMPIGIRYEGMEVYVKNIKAYYRLIGGVENSNWSVFNPLILENIMENLSHITLQLSQELGMVFSLPNISIVSLSDIDEYDTNMELVDNSLFM